MADRQEDLEESAGVAPELEEEADAAARRRERRGEARAMRGADPEATARAREFFSTLPVWRAVLRRGRR